MRFKEFILNEQKAYLAQKVGDILTAAHELNNDAQHIGTRDLIRFSERIVNQIRRILHSNWTKEEKKYLLNLQKVGVAIMKSIEDKDDLPGTISGSVSILEKIVSDLGMPINKLAVTDSSSEDNDDKNLSEPIKKNKDQSVPPPSPKTVASSGPLSPPSGGTGQDLMSPPLGGSSGPMDAF
jgi:hypothetical protein